MDDMDEVEVIVKWKYAEEIPQPETITLTLEQAIEQLKSLHPDKNIEITK